MAKTERQTIKRGTSRTTYRKHSQCIKHSMSQKTKDRRDHLRE